jgi:hypothetical protein
LTIVQFVNTVDDFYFAEPAAALSERPPWQAVPQNGGDSETVYLALSVIFRNTPTYSRQTAP